MPDPKALARDPLNVDARMLEVLARLFGPGTQMNPAADVADLFLNADGQQRGLKDQPSIDERAFARRPRTAGAGRDINLPQSALVRALKGR